MRRFPMSKLVTRLGVPALAALAFAGCGGSKSSTSTTSTNAAATKANPAIAAQVPASVKAKGTLIVASEAQYAPNEFIAPDGHPVIGMDPDMVKAIAGVLGLKAQV